MLRSSAAIFLFQVVEKVFPLLSLWLVSVYFAEKDVDLYSYGLVVVSTIVSWSASGIGVATTKAAARSDKAVLSDLASSSIFMTICSVLVFVFILREDFPSILVMILGFLASLVVFYKHVLIAKYKWNGLFFSFVLGLLISVGAIFGIAPTNLDSRAVIVAYYLPLLVCLFIYTRKEFKYHINWQRIISVLRREVGPLYFTGIIAGSFILSVIYVLEDYAEEGFTTKLTIFIQAITLMQFSALSLVRSVFISMNRGEEVRHKRQVVFIFGLLLISLLIVKLFFPLLGSVYEEVADVNNWLLLLSSLSATLATYVGNILVTKDKQLTWLYITVVSFVLAIGYAVFFNSEYSGGSLILLAIGSILIKDLAALLLSGLYLRKNGFLYI